MIFPGVLLLVPLAMSGAEFFSWHAFETRLVTTSTFELNLHHRTRTRHEFHYLDQLRVGPTFRITINPRVAMVGGYYFQPQQIRQHQWTRGQRVFAGIETPLLTRPRSIVSFRLVAERHINTSRPNYNRYRTSTRWVIGAGRVKPFLQSELLAVWPGFHSTRNSGGLQIRLSPQLSLDASYLYDVRRTFWGGDRQALVTALRWIPKRNR